MNYYITNEEYAEISAKIDASIENLSFSETEDVPNTEEIEYIPVTSSIVDSENWKKFIEIRNRNEKEQLDIQEKFSEALSSLREATYEAIVEPVSKLETIIEDHQEVQEPDEEIYKPYDSFSGNNDFELTSYYDLQIKLKEKEKEDKESTLMAEEDLLSKLFQTWTEKLLKIQQEILIKEKKKLEEIEIKKKEQEEYIKIQEIKRTQKELESKLQREKIKIENRKKAEETLRETKENQVMSVEDRWSLEYRSYMNAIELKKILDREWKLMAIEDQRGLVYRNLVPYSRKQFLLLTSISDYPKISGLPKRTINTYIKILTPVASNYSPAFNQSFISLPLPKPIKVVTIPGFTEESDLEQPVLNTFLPYPLDPASSSLEVKHEEIKSISGLKSFNNLRSLTLSLNKISKIQNIPGTLIHLDLSQNLIKTIPDLQLPILEELILDINQIACISGLYNCTNLRTLSLNTNNIKKISGLEKLNLLEKLLLYRNKIKDIPSTAFNYNPYLNFIDLGRNKLTSVSFLKPLKLVKSLILYQNKISHIEKLNLPLLQQLWLNGNALKALDFLEQTPLLETLRLEDNSISSIEICSFPILKFMNVSFNSISSFYEILNCIKGSRNIVNFAFNDNPFLAIHPDLVPIYNEIIVKSLPGIQELNTTPRTSLQPLLLNNSNLCRRSFELHQIDLYVQKAKRNKNIIIYTSEAMKLLLFQLPSKIYSQISPILEFSTNNIEYHWYQASKSLYYHTRAALVIQSWWKHKSFKRFMIVSKYSPYISSIVLIQKVFRGWKVRKNYLNIRYNPKKIVKIQAFFRGFSLRKKLKKALDNAKFNDLDLSEFKEVTLDDVYTNYDFHEDLIIPKNLDLSKFFINPIPEESKTPKLPPLKTSSALKHNSGPMNRSISGDKSLQTSTQSSLPPLNKNKAKEDMEKHLEEWGFANNEVKEALQYRMMKNMQRKTKGKKLTADERLEKFKKSTRK